MAAQVPGLVVYDDGTLGVWSAPTFAAGDYTASGAMTWTVDSADAQVSYFVLGKTMIVAFRLGATSIGGTVSTDLYIKIPGTKTANRTTAAPIWVVQAGPVFEAGYAQVTSGATNITLRRQAEGNWVASTNNTYVFGQLWFEIQ